MIPPRDISRAILSECAAKHGITVHDLLHDRRRNRRKLLVAARRECARRLRLERNMSTPQIGALMKRDHTSVLYLLGRLKSKPVPAGFRRVRFGVGSPGYAREFTLTVSETTLAAADALAVWADKIAWWRDATGDERFAGELIIWRAETSGES